MLENDTRSQHYVTLGEQRLNARNPQADPRNMRIYLFTVVDRENYTLALESPNGTLIRKKPVTRRHFQLRRSGRPPATAQFRVTVPQKRIWNPDDLLHGRHGS
jgi:hypothetical protein